MQLAGIEYKMEKNNKKQRKAMRVCTGQCVDCNTNYQWKNIMKIRCDGCQKIHHKNNMYINNKKRYSNEEYRNKVQKYNNKWRDENRQKVYDKDRERRNTPESKLKERARELARSIPIGKECGICKSTKNLQKHHWRYDKPLLVSTMCSECHTIQHIKNKPMELTI